MSGAADNYGPTAAQWAREVLDRVDLPGMRAEMASAQKAIAEPGPEAGEADPQTDPMAASDWTPDTFRGLPAEIGSAIGDALPWLEAREGEARAASDAEAWGGRGPSASHAEWAAEGTASTPAGPQPDGPEAGA
jgi:hypothetical protein